MSWFLGNFLDLICPPLCPLCQRIIEEKAPFCDECAEKLATPKEKLCRRCGGRRFQQLQETGDCRRCRTTKFLFHKVIALGEYETELRKLVLRMKTEKSGHLATLAAKLLIRLRGEELRKVEPEWIIPIPMHRRRRWLRGVNSPDFLADELGRFLKVSVLKNRIERFRPTEMQYTLSTRGRKENVAGAFQIKNRKIFNVNEIHGKRILLVDDILTTGSTCNELSRLLRKSGAAGVWVCVLARAEGIYAQNTIDRMERIFVE